MTSVIGVRTYNASPICPSLWDQIDQIIRVSRSLLLQLLLRLSSFQTAQSRYACVTLTSRASLLTMHKALNILSLLTRCSGMTCSIYTTWHALLELPGNIICISSYMSYKLNVCHASGLTILQTSNDWILIVYKQRVLQYFQSCLLKYFVAPAKTPTHLGSGERLDIMALSTIVAT